MFEILKKKKTKLTATLVFTMVFMLSMGTMVFAADPSPAPLDLTQVTSAITSSINAGQILSIIATILSASMGLVLTWWGARKLIRAIMSAFRKGKVSV